MQHDSPRTRSMLEHPPAMQERPPALLESPPALLESGPARPRREHRARPLPRGRHLRPIRPLRLRLLRAERGNALVEFVVLSAALLIPSLYLVLTLGNVQAAAFAADTISRDVARIHAMEQDPARAQQRAQAHTALILEDYGLASSDVTEVSCSKDPCATPGGTVGVQVRIPVPVPGLGMILGDVGPVSVGASHLLEVDQYRQVEP